MTDLEMIKLCAEAMGLGEPYYRWKTSEDGRYLFDTASGTRKYNPLHDDAQAMGLVKRLRLRVLPQFNGRWCADTGEVSVAKYYVLGEGETPNHAIVACAAKMQKNK